MVYHDKEIKRYMNWRSKSMGDAVIYTSIEYRDGSQSCNCPAWAFKKGDKPRDCTHCKMMRGTKPVDRSLIVSDDIARKRVSENKEKYADVASIILGTGRRIKV